MLSLFVLEKPTVVQKIARLREKEILKLTEIQENKENFLYSLTVFYLNKHNQNNEMHRQSLKDGQENVL